MKATKVVTLEGKDTALFAVPKKEVKPPFPEGKGKTPVAPFKEGTKVDDSGLSFKQVMKDLTALHDVAIQMKTKVTDNTVTIESHAAPALEALGKAIDATMEQLKSAAKRELGLK